MMHFKFAFNKVMVMCWGNIPGFEDGRKMIFCLHADLVKRNKAKVQLEKSLEGHVFFLKAIL